MLGLGCPLTLVIGCDVDFCHGLYVHMELIVTLIDDSVKCLDTI